MTNTQQQNFKHILLLKNLFINFKQKKQAIEEILNVGAATFHQLAILSTKKMVFLIMERQGTLTEGKGSVQLTSLLN
jgi:hypothetical protein